MVQSSYQLKKQNGLHKRSEHTLFFSRLWFQNMISGPSSYRVFRETGSWPFNLSKGFLLSRSCFSTFKKLLPQANHQKIMHNLKVSKNCPRKLSTHNLPPQKTERPLPHQIFPVKWFFSYHLFFLDRLWTGRGSIDRSVAGSCWGQYKVRSEMASVILPLVQVLSLLN